MKLIGRRPDSTPKPLNVGLAYYLCAVLSLSSILGSVSELEKKGCGQLLWFVGFQFRASSGAEIFYVAENAEYVRALKVAILSAKAKAPDLIPIVVVAGPLPASQNSFIRWLQRHGAWVLPHTLSFQKDMSALAKDPQWAFSQNILGSWLRVDLPHVMDDLLKQAAATPSFEKLLAKVDLQYILWTDPDVIFQGRINACTLARPPVMSVGPEKRMGYAENFGVIYFNVTGYREIFPELMAFAKEHSFRILHDQNLFLAFKEVLNFWGHALTTLPSAMNWKPYWGGPASAMPGPWGHGHILIVHAHGPKISTAVCFFDQLELPGRKLFDSTKALQRCGLKKSPNGSQEWLQELAQILIDAYAMDGGQLYRDMQQQFEAYLRPQPRAISQE